jgi:transcription-repair coupling factor (superfamily II helicase)
LTGILNTLPESKTFRDVLKRIARGANTTYIAGLSGSRKSLFIAGLLWHTQRTVFVVTSNQLEADAIAGDLTAFAGPGRVFVFPPVDMMPYEEAPLSADLSAARTRALVSLMEVGRQCAVVAPVRSLGKRTVPISVFREHVFRLRQGDFCDLGGLADRLVAGGYEILAKVEARGQASVRGGIVDIFAHDADWPARIELFGDEIESIRSFDVNTQRSTGLLDEAVITPAREFLYDSERLSRACTAIRGELERVGRSQLRERVVHHLERFENGARFDNEEQYLPFFYPERISVADWAPGALFIIDEPLRVKEALDGYEADLRETYASLLQAGMILPSQAESYLCAQDIVASIDKRQAVSISLLSRETGAGAEDEDASVIAPVKQADLYAGRFEDLVHDIKKYRKRQYRVVCAVSTIDRRDRLAETLEYNGAPAAKLATLDEVPDKGSVSVVAAEMTSGFQYPDMRLLLLTDAEIYGRQKKRRLLAAAEEGARIASYTDLTPGDYVVHVNHGVGRYSGVQKLEVGGVQRDYLLVQYAGEDRVYVPTDQVAMLQKYIGMEDAAPRLHKLGGGEWARAKNRARESARDMAQSLLKLYAARGSVKGYSFSRDTVWQQEFEDAFQYEETPDQWRAIVDVKRDMEKPAPMDRLLCGDVGFGKTEVALRAAFKAAADGKQVAVLTPTTILTQQHYNTFTERFRGFPMRVAMLSRFQTEAEQREIVRGIRMGTVDVVIGTHRLLSQDIAFRDLGLLVVDEEQRFGVVQKERIKELRKEVDVLTLTATPIPRTLHMAMVGVRDMSLIETPPENRFPIRTYVLEQNETLIREAVLREVDRGGQVYFVHNRVQTIDEAAAGLGRLAPEVSIGVAHGQMPEDRLERVMLEFLAGEFDVLVCTAIIESGIDIPNVNTIVINDAQNFGLAQLYQLRGRVGRTNRVAYAYLLFRRDLVLTELAEKRLAAIREFTSLGSGYKIALRDLEIRGAGNILGAEQHGHIAAVGFEMYCRLLEEEIRELKGEAKRPEPAQVLIDLPVDAFMPDSYVSDSRQKIDVYKKINGVDTMEDAADLAREFVDRFGPLPAPASNLITIAAIRVLARELGVMAIAGERNSVIVRFPEGVRYASQDIIRIARPFKGRVMLGAGRTQTIRVRTQGMPDREILDTLVGVLTEMRQRAAAVDRVTRTQEAIDG